MAEPDGALIGVVSHASHGETRVAATPASLSDLKRSVAEVW